MFHRCVFLDRDGTINEEVRYLNDVAQLRLIDGAVRGVQLLNQAGFKVVVITNQAGVARGYLTEETLDSIHRALRAKLRLHSARIDAIYYCPHHPTAGEFPYRRRCDCRKPSSGMLRRAATELDINLATSFLVGDKISDLEAGLHVGCKVILVRTGYGWDIERRLVGHPFQPDYVAADILEASEWILERSHQH